MAKKRPIPTEGMARARRGRRREAEDLQAYVDKRNREKTPTERTLDSLKETPEERLHRLATAPSVNPGFHGLQGKARTRNSRRNQRRNLRNAQRG